MICSRSCVLGSGPSGYSNGDVNIKDYMWYMAADQDSVAL